MSIFQKWRGGRDTRTSAIEMGDATHTPLVLDDVETRGGSGPVRRASDELNAAQSMSEVDRLLSNGKPAQEVPLSERKGWISVFGIALPKRLLLLLALPLGVLVIFLFSRSAFPALVHPIATLSNGTHPYHPTTLLISLDGFRASYLDTYADLVPNLLALANSTHGVRAESMQPRFPTLTFPNHWSLMTGLYPESHGIVANDFWDPVHGRHFVYTKQEQSWDADWWWGEPMWSVAQRGGRTTANLMWPGPPVTARGIAPSLFVPYRVSALRLDEAQNTDEQKMKPADKLSQLTEWLDLPVAQRPQLLTTYIPNIDEMGHAGGPDSGSVQGALKLVDGFIGDVVEALHQRSLNDIVNLLIVSDHGMTTTANERLIFFDDILGEKGFNDIEHRDGWPSVGLRFKEGSPVDEYLQILLDAEAKSDGSFAVYTHDTMPERWHFNATERIAPIYIVPKIGWALTDNHEHKVINKGDYQPKGNHGYDNVEADMQAVFFAHGPFAKSIKATSRRRDGTVKRGWVSTEPHVMESFANLEIFSLVMRLMGLESLEPPHNGTVGFWDGYLKDDR